MMAGHSLFHGAVRDNSLKAFTITHLAVMIQWVEWEQMSSAKHCFSLLA